VAIVNPGARRLIISALFFCLACAAAPPPEQQQQHQPQFLTVHLEDSDNKAAHDEIQIPGGLVVEDYPDRISPRRVYFRYPQGGIMDLTCRDFSNNPCRDWTMRITGFKSDHMPKGFNIFLPEGTYLLLNTDDPHLQVIKTADTQVTMGYWVTQVDGFIHIVGTYQQALAMEGPR